MRLKMNNNKEAFKRVFVLYLSRERYFDDSENGATYVTRVDDILGIFDSHEKAMVVCRVLEPIIAMYSAKRVYMSLLTKEQRELFHKIGAYIDQGDKHIHLRLDEVKLNYCGVLYE